MATDAARGVSTTGKQAEVARLETSIRNLTQAMQQQKSLETELSHAAKEIADAKAAGADVNDPTFKSFQRAADGLSQKLNDLNTAIAKTVADVEGVQMIPENKPKSGGNNRGGRRP